VARVDSFLRLAAAVWILIRADALLPRELDVALPEGVQTLARLLRLFAGPLAKRGRPGERLASTLVRLGPVGIKFGQFLSTRADILGLEVAADLAHLKDRLPPFPTETAKAEIERALSATAPTLLAEVGAPVAAASLAQVHVARLDDGRKAAVKVLRPRIERRVADDAAALVLGAHIAHWLFPRVRRLAPREFAATVVRALQLELDMRLESAAIDELREVMARDGFMRAPQVIWSGVARRVLVLQWASGLPLSDPRSLDQEGLDRSQLAINLIRGFLAQALDHGVFHADLHEGNLFVEAPAKLMLVDFGIIGRLGETDRRHLAEILWGFLRRDYQLVAEVHFRAGYVPAGQDRASFAQALRAVGESVFGQRASQLSMARLLGQLFEVTALFDMALRPELVLLQKTMVTVEGVARRIDPDHDIWSAAEPIVRRWIERELSPRARIRRAFDEIREVVRAIPVLAARQGVPANATAAADHPPAKASSGWAAFALGVLVAVGVLAAVQLLR
jgi:ubiquinone biosynthesis protein